MREHDLKVALIDKNIVFRMNLWNEWFDTETLDSSLIMRWPKFIKIQPTLQAKHYYLCLFICSRLSREKERMQSDYDHLKQEHENLEERHQRFIIQYGHEGSETMKGNKWLYPMA